MEDSFGDGGLSAGVYDPGVGAYVDYFSMDGYGSSASFAVGGGLDVDETDCITVNLNAGDYSYTVTVTDAYGASSSDDVSVSVASETNASPSSDAGSDIEVTVAHDGDPSDQGIEVEICGSGSDPEGDSFGYSWSSGEDTDCMTQLLTAGSHSFSLTVTDAYGASSSDDMSVTISAEPNDGPSADAGSDQSAEVAHDGDPGTTTYAVSISGSGSDPEGDAIATGWSHVDCQGQSFDPYYLSWLGDGWCDDGAYGMYFDCDTYNWDNNDCEVGC